MMLWHLDALLEESVDWKNEHIEMVLLYEEEEPNGRLKEQRGAEFPHSSEP